MVNDLDGFLGDLDSETEWKAKYQMCGLCLTSFHGSMPGIATFMITARWSSPGYSCR